MQFGDFISLKTEQLLKHRIGMLAQFWPKMLDATRRFRQARNHRRHDHGFPQILASIAPDYAGRGIGGRRKYRRCCLADPPARRSQNSVEHFFARQGTAPVADDFIHIMPVFQPGFLLAIQAGRSQFRSAHRIRQPLEQLVGGAGDSHPFAYSLVGKWP
jgi:hypothetical protein